MKLTDVNHVIFTAEEVTGIKLEADQRGVRWQDVMHEKAREFAVANRKPRPPLEPIAVEDLTDAQRDFCKEIGLSQEEYVKNHNALVEAEKAQQVLRMSIAPTGH